MGPLNLNNKIYVGAAERQSLYDLEIPEIWNGKVVVFVHGYMGFKDWGAWHLMMKHFVNEGFAFVKYNVSHNGGTIENPIDFPDLGAFQRNRYSYELEDLDRLIKNVSKYFPEGQKYHLIGHSRGGGIALLYSCDQRIKAISTLAAISDIGSRFPSGTALDSYQTEGIYYRQNGRTKQNMPHLYAQYLDYLDHSGRLDIQFYCEHAKCPIQVIHGENDSSVGIEEGELITKWLRTELIVIPKTAHTFNTSHPFSMNELPAPFESAIRQIQHFFEANG